MAEQTYTVQGMTCEHCAGAVSREVRLVDGVGDVHVDVSTGTLTVESNGPISSDAIAAAVDEAGYTVVAGL